MTEQEFVEKIDAGKSLSESEIKSLIYDYDFGYVDIPGELLRWTQRMITIVKLCGRYFAIHWERGLTERQDDDFWNSFIKEVKPKERITTVTDWVATKDSTVIATSSKLNN